MRTTTPIDVAHLVQVITDDRTYGLGSQAQCSCGWLSNWHTNPAAADDAGVDHTETAVGPPDGLDRVMSDLLDLQDDLAQAVIWLAENWSATLPTPHPCGRTWDDDRPGVNLLTYCADLDELARVAKVIGATAIDHEPNSHGTRYRRAVRRFGRVHIDAYTTLGTSTEATP